MSLRNRLHELTPRRFFLETWKALDAEVQTRDKDSGYDTRPWIALALGAVFLTLMEYFGSSAVYTDLLYELGVEDNEKFHRLSGYAWWAGFRVLGYFIFPALVVKGIFRAKLRDYGLRTQGFVEHAWVYMFFFSVVLCGVIGVSFWSEFSEYYPFYKLATRSWFDFIAWELLYAAQFFSLEFFFRGFWLNACKPTMGSQAIFAMVVPYCMIHYGKPWLEALAAIVAGIVLGTLAMKTRSIWSGFLIHVSVAVSMDVAAILQTSDLPNTFWPM